jgi:selenocysteine-specific elongation factor
VERLRRLPQPFTTSQARQALDTTRRVAIPVLEYLDRIGRTQRLDGQLRRVGQPPANGRTASAADLIEE